jgi:hypothetical protein
MRCNHDLWRCRVGNAIERTFADTALGEPLANDGIVDEFTQNRERTFRGKMFGLRDGVTDAEAKAVVFCEFDGHKMFRFA